MSQYDTIEGHSQELTILTMRTSHMLEYGCPFFVPVIAVYKAI